MISLYRWQPGQKHGVWVDLPDLPAERDQVPEGEVWWLDVDDPSEEEIDLVYKEFLPIHSLSLEDITRPKRESEETPHLPKVEEFPDYLFVIANLLRPGPDDPNDASKPIGPAAFVQLSAVITDRVLVTHRYQVLPAITDIKQFCFRHAEQAGRGPDNLFHLVLDSLVDEFAPEIDRIVERLEEIEVTLFRRGPQQLIFELIRLKRRVISLRKTLVLMREVLARLTRGEFELVNVREIAYYRNVYDHLLRYTELIEVAREMISDLMQTHLAAVSNRMNRVMKLLAMVSTVILPMSLIASIYGMNFEVMPEIKWQYGYPFALGLMFVVAMVAVWVFYRQKWLE
jgi:magnesium transporter